MLWLWIALSGLVFSAVLTPSARRLAWRWSLVDQPDGAAHKSHQQATPYGGGLAILLGVLLPLGLLVIYGLAVGGRQFLSGPFGELQVDIRMALLLLGGGAVLFGVGLADDWRPLPPLPRFLIELAVVGLLVAIEPGFRLSFLSDNSLLAALLGLVWIVAMTNAFNFLDNMDGLTGGIAAILLACMGLVALSAGHHTSALLALLTAGACSGFLFYNFPPASIFMGDAGGFLLGFWAGSLSAWESQGLTVAAGSVDWGWGLPLLPFFILGVPVYDFLSVILIRARNGMPPWIGDKNHISHRLVDLGLSRRSAVLVIYAFCVLTALPSLAVVHFRIDLIWLVPVLLGVFLVACVDFRARRRLNLKAAS
ncbi:MAG: hypothetical protein GKR89_08165 [Candidatus Latescibacteria bacterium]|nr:hypothetical protein [Candidatus Latescibacterota bacterium]